MSSGWGSPVSAGAAVKWLYAAGNPAVKAGVAWYRGPLLVGWTPADAGNSAIRQWDREYHPKDPIDLVADLRAPVLGFYGGADPGDDLVAEFDREPTGNGDDVGQGHLLTNHGVVIGKAFRIGGSRGAKAARGVGLAPSILHRVRAGIVGAHRDDDFAGAVDHDGRDGVALGGTAVDRGLRDRFGNRIREIAVGQQLRLRERDDGAREPSVARRRSKIRDIADLQFSGTPSIVIRCKRRRSP